MARKKITEEDRIARREFKKMMGASQIAELGPLSDAIKNFGDSRRDEYLDGIMNRNRESEE